ncbi:sacsin N-terminal ATP-binding-like domain-containing protein [Chryseobacterium lacus]|uniref:sacsin N-terminal ATP-binding-like domain-containing protein n=1 Tax=Chryseobacterium lacus TaxID=2058346 RepID=UPI000F86ED79|nr:hypothetical protein [Chryseobacterium lacus]RST29389.1 hypothetical protein EIZ46_00005 [Chryseobacterium lacus]
MENKTLIEAPESVNNAFNELLNKMYISNVRNRLRQLNEPTENDCKRWIWELIQNAKDSISQDPDKSSVDVKIIAKENEVIFKHNGSPFTAKAQLGLLYKYSEGKVNNSESTGRFGTGFLTTHTLSKIVSIEGDVFTNDDKELCGFSATMYRDGLDEPELLEGVEKMRKSMIYTKELNNWTTYTYHLNTPQNKNALTLGLKDFIQNIAQVMLFCKELNTVELDNNGEITKIIRKEPQELSNKIFLSEFKINNSTRRFIHKYVEEHSEELTKRFKTDRNVRLMAAIEIDKENNLVENETAPSHFCVLPLVGSEKHIMPVYLNSPDFEPDSERESLILIGEDMLADKEVISEGGINRLILKKSIELYDSLVSYLSASNFHKLYLLAKGLKRVPDFEKSFNKEWFEKEMILSYREVLKKYAIVETENGNQKLFNDDDTPNIIIPQGNKEVRQKIYSLASELFPTNLPLEKYASDWAHLAWSDCRLFQKEDFCQFVARKQNASNLPSYDWLNKFLSFIKEEDEALLKKYALVPNSNGDLISLEDETFSEGIELTEYMLGVLNNLGKDLTPSLLNINITAITLPIKIDKKWIAEKINEQAETIIKDTSLSVSEIIEKLLPLLNTIPTNETNYNTEFIKKQNQIHNFAKALYPDFKVIENTNNDIPEKAFEALHYWLIKQFMVDVSECKSIDSLPESIENKFVWVNKFIAFVSKEIKEGELDEYAIIPNQNSEFCFKKDLSLDDNIPEILKTEQAEKFGLILKDSLLHKELNALSIGNKKDINTVIGIINDLFKSNKFENGITDLDFAIYLLHLLPEESSPTLYNSQKKLLEIVQKYDYETCESYTTSEIKCSNEDFWRKTNKVIVDSYNSRIEEDNTIDGLKVYLSEQTKKDYDFGDTVIFLNDYYDYLTSIKIPIDSSIIPNQNGEFRTIDDLFKDDEISKELKDVLYLVNSDEDYRNILAESSLSIQPTHSKSVEDIAKPIDEAIKETFADSRNWDDENFKKAVAILTKYFRIHGNRNDFFKYSWNKKDTIELNVLVGEDGIKILQSLHNGELDIEQIKQKDNEIAQLKEENTKLKTKNEELEKLLAEKEEIEKEKIKLEERLIELVKTDPNSSEIEIIQGEIKLKDDEIAVLSDTTIAISYDDDISVSDQKEANREAKEIVKERLENEGFSFKNGIDGYSTIDGVIKDGIEFPLVVKSYKYQDAPLKIGANEWIQLMKPNSMFWVHFGNRRLGCLNLYDLMRKQDKLSLSFSTENLDYENRLENFADILHYFKNVHFDFNSIRPDNYSTAENLNDYRFNEKRTEDDLSSDDDSLL